VGEGRGGGGGIRVGTPHGQTMRRAGRGPLGRGGRYYTTPQKLVLAFIGCYFVVHLVVPLRHFFLYNGLRGDHPNWSEEGHLAAWHMMLRSKVGIMFFVATDTEGRRIMFRPEMDPTLTRRHVKKVTNRPHTSLVYAKYISKVFRAAGQPLDKIQVVSCFQLNGRRSQRLFDHRVGRWSVETGPGPLWCCRPCHTVVRHNATRGVTHVQTHGGCRCAVGNLTPKQPKLKSQITSATQSPSPSHAAGPPRRRVSRGCVLEFPIPTTTSVTGCLEVPAQMLYKLTRLSHFSSLCVCVSGCVLSPPPLTCSIRRPSRPVNLLPWVDKYENAGVTAVGKFMFPLLDYSASAPAEVRLVWGELTGPRPDLRTRLAMTSRPRVRHVPAKCLVAHVPAMTLQCPSSGASTCTTPLL